MFFVRRGFLGRYRFVLTLMVVAVALLGGGCVSGRSGIMTQNVTVEDRFVTPAGRIETQTVTIPSPPKRVVVLGSYAAEMLKALGVEDAVIAVDDHTREKDAWPAYVTKLAGVGRSNTPSIEKILALKPDLVIEAFLEAKYRRQLREAGVAVLKIYGYKTELIPAEIRTLGKVFNREARANTYADFIETQWQKVKERTARLDAEQKPRVYWESSLGDWKTHGPGSGAHPLIEWAGGVNIAAGQKISYPAVAPEWVAAKDPDVIIKYVAAPVTGWHGDEKELARIRQELMARPALKDTEAAKNGRVYLVSSKITCAPQGAAGLYYIAKWLHPELFRDVNPEAVHREMLKKFYGEETKGVWVYPPLK